MAKQLRVFSEAGSITTNGARASHSLHPLALLWSNPAGLVRRGAWPSSDLGIWMGSPHGSARANADDQDFNYSTLGFKTPRIQRSCDARDAELSANRR